MLQTHNYGKSKLSIKIPVMAFDCESYETRSTTINDPHLFDSGIQYSRIHLANSKSTVTWSLNKKIYDLLKMATMPWYQMCVNNYSSFFYSVILPCFFLFFCSSMMYIYTHFWC
jgi:hypothetical protein